MKKHILLFGAILFAGYIGKAASIRVEPSETVELMSVIMTLTGAQEYNSSYIWPEYKKVVDERFADYKDHPAVKYAFKLRNEYGFAFDVPMKLAINSQIKNGEFIYVDKRGLEVVKMTPPRWSESEHKELIAAINLFYKESDFNDFFRSNKDLYLPVQETLEKLFNEALNLEWLSGFMGDKTKIDYTVALSYLAGNVSFGPDVKIGEDIIPRPIMGIFDRDGFIAGNDYVSLRMPIVLIHEYLHPYCNPLIDKHYSELEPSGNVIFPLFEKQLQRQGCRTWKMVMYEALVRASVVAYMKSDDGFKDKVSGQIIYEEDECGFQWLGSLVDKLGEYDTNRDKYPTLESFMPEIVGFYNELAVKVAQQQSKTQ